MTTTPMLTVPALSAKRVCDMMVGAFEGGSNYWVEGAIQTAGKVDPEEKVVWWGQEGFWASDFKVELATEDDDEVLTPDKILKGQQILLEKFPRRWAEIVGETDDAETADVFLQVCLFGEVRYG